jgi:GT2 family glycosyltransferase
VVEQLASIVVPSLNGAHLLPECLESLRRQSYAPLEVIVADGASSDSTRELLAECYAEVRLLRLRRNRGFSGNVNAGIRAARGDFVLLLNNDARAEPDWAAECVRALRVEPGLGSVASKVLYREGGTINSAGDLVGRDGTPRQRGNGMPDGPSWNESVEVFGAMGGAAAYRRTMLADVGLLDEVLFMYLEDVDLAFRARLRGWSCRYQPSAVVVHRGGASGGGPLESFYNGRNLIRVLAKNVPSALLPILLPRAVHFQVERARAALDAWRGAAARATLRGQLVGLAEMPRHLADRFAIQRRRSVSDEHIWSLLTP